MKIELEKFIPVIIPGFLYSFYVRRYEGDITKFIILTLFYSLMFIVLAYLLNSFVQIIFIKASWYSVFLITGLLTWHLKRVKAPTEYASEAGRQLGKIRSEGKEAMGKAVEKIIKNLQNPDSLFYKSNVLYFSILGVSISIFVDRFIIGSRQQSTVLSLFTVFFTLSVLLTNRKLNSVKAMYQAYRQVKNNMKTNLESTE